MAETVSNVLTPAIERARKPAPAGYRMCTRCVMDTTDPEIVFDDNGVCNHCIRAIGLLQTRLPIYKTGEYRFDRIVDRMRAEGRGRQYDCLVGVSGGMDSTYVAYLVRRAGLRALAVHFDNGWNSELAVSNISNTLNRMGIELYTHVVDWEEFRDLQWSFLQASVPDAEVPTDHGIWALLYRTAARWRIGTIVTGTNLSTESILPRSWTYGITDWTYISGIHRQFGSKALRTYPQCNRWQFGYYAAVRRIRTVSLLNSVDYDKRSATAELEREIGYRHYGGKHHESIYTRFFQSYILPIKFDIDKRKAHLSSLILSGQVTRPEAIETLGEPIADPKMVESDLTYVIKKLGVGRAEFERIMALPPRSFRDYRNEWASYERLRSLMRLGQRYGLLPPQVGM
jgi:N-acetyl sugar amidotransferase